jgi:hypothetical protein
MRESLEAALAQLYKLGARAELQDSYYPIYVPIGTFLKFDSPDWEIVFGSPGSGKTILLKAWQEAAFDALDRPRVLPIYISGRELRGAPDEGGAAKVLAERYFQAFLEHFGIQIREVAERARARHFHFAVHDDRIPRRKVRTVDELLEAIDQAIIEGRPARSPQATEYEEEDVEEAGRRMKLGARLLGRLSEFPRLIAGVFFERSRSRTSTARRRLRRTGTMTPHFVQVNKHLKELADVLGVDRFCVLLDEWSAIDAAAQPWLAEWLLRAFAGNQRVAIKVASNRTHTRLWDEQREIGFRLGVDLFDAGALDHPQMTEADLIAFFETMLFKRLVAISSDLGPAYVRDRTGRPHPELIESIFASRDAFEALAVGTEGIPRIFLATFQNLIDRGLPPGGWTLEEVREVVGAPEQPIDAKVFKDEVTEGEIAFHWVIRPVAVATESRFFLVRAEDREQAAESFAELLKLRLIYRDPSSTLPESLKESFDGYWLSEELWGTLGRAILYKRGLSEKESQGPTEGLLYANDPEISSWEGAQQYVVNFDEWRA